MTRACVCLHARGEHRGGRRECRLCPCAGYSAHRPPAAPDDSQLALWEEHAHARARIYDALHAAGRMGLTFEEVARAAGVPENTARGRLSELHAEGVAVESWRRRRVASGRRAVVYVLAEHAPVLPAARAAREAV